MTDSYAEIAYHLGEPQDLREQLRLSNSYNRLPIVIALWWEGDMTEGAWLSLLGDQWSICDNVSRYLDELLNDTPLGNALADPGPVRHLLMTPDEQAAYAALPDVVTIYRGCYRANRNGLSWTTDKAMAMKFPGMTRYRGEGYPLLIKATIPKAEILAVKLDRQEAEIICPRPKHVATNRIRVAPPF